MSHKLSEKSETVRLGIRIPHSLKKKIKAAAKLNGQSLSEFVRNVVEIHIRND